VNYVFCKSTTINEIHDSSPHVCKNYFILLLGFKIFVFTNKMACQWDLILLPSSLHSNGRHKFIHELLVLALHWTMLVVDIIFLLRHETGKD
jgi:hypothetical protein